MLDLTKHLVPDNPDKLERFLNKLSPSERVLCAIVAFDQCNFKLETLLPTHHKQHLPVLSTIHNEIYAWLTDTDRDTTDLFIGIADSNELEEQVKSGPAGWCVQSLLAAGRAVTNLNNNMSYTGTAVVMAGLCLSNGKGHGIGPFFGGWWADLSVKAKYFNAQRSFDHGTVGDGIGSFLRDYVECEPAKQCPLKITTNKAIYSDVTIIPYSFVEHQGIIDITFIDQTGTVRSALWSNGKIISENREIISAVELYRQTIQKPLRAVI